MIEPTMKAIPARKNSRPTTSPAAARLSANPVSEIAFGRQARLDQPVARAPGRGRDLLALAARRRCGGRVASPGVGLGHCREKE
jgi:hypothetical protein